MEHAERSRRRWSLRATIAIMLVGALGFSAGCQASPEPEGTSSSRPETSAGSDAGKAIYMEAGCAQCHSVAAEAIEATVTSEQLRGPDLSRIGRERDAAWIVAYMKTGQAAGGETHRVPYRGSDDDLQVMADWLAGLR
jgi:cbb3-type cytochrome oxidase cytochrome c subunit